MFVYILLVLIQPKFLSYAAAYIVYIACTQVFPNMGAFQANSVQAAVHYFRFCHIAFFQFCNKVRITCGKYKFCIS